VSIWEDICEEAFDVERKKFRTRIAELEAETSKLKVAVEHASPDALSNLEHLISVEAENKRLREALKQISKNEYGCPDAECIDCHCTWCVARRALGGEG